MSEAAPPSPSLDPIQALAALANPFRWQFVRLMADGSEWSASAVADRFGRDFDGVSKHLRQLRSAGILSSRRGQDRRTELFFLPAPFRATRGELDLGFALLRLPEARPDAAPEARDAVPSRLPVSAVPPRPTSPPPAERVQASQTPQTPQTPQAPQVPQAPLSGPLGPHPLAGVRFFAGASGGDDEEGDGVEEPPACGFGEMIRQQQPFRFR